MSVLGALALTSVGGFLYKFDQTQKYEIHPNTDCNISEYGVNIVKPEIIKLKRWISSLLLNFFPDLTYGQPFAYPFRGIFDMFKHVDSYSYVVFGTFFVYVINFIWIFILYWATIAPLYFAFFLVLGPFGFVLAFIQAVLHANLFVMLFMRMSHLSNDLVRVGMLNNSEDNNIWGPCEPVKYYVPVRTQYFWLVHFPTKLLRYTIGIFFLVIVIGVSFLPIIGPFMFYIIISPLITKIYFSKFLRIRGVNNVQRLDLFFTKFGCYTSFGLVAGMLEVFPIISGIMLSSNTIGATLLAMEVFKDVESTECVESTDCVESTTNQTSQTSQSTLNSENLGTSENPVTTELSPTSGTNEPFSEGRSEDNLQTQDNPGVYSQSPVSDPPLFQPGSKGYTEDTEEHKQQPFLPETI